MATKPLGTYSTKCRQQQLQSSAIHPTDPDSAFEPCALPVFTTRARSSSSITSTDSYPTDSVHNKSKSRRNRPRFSQSTPTPNTTTHHNEPAGTRGAVDRIPTFISTLSPLPVQNPRGPTNAPTRLTTSSYPPCSRFPISTTTMTTHDVTGIPAFIFTDPSTTEPARSERPHLILSTRAPPTVDEPDTEVQTIRSSRCSNPSGGTWKSGLEKTRPTATTCRNSPATCPPSLPRQIISPDIIMMDYDDDDCGDEQPTIMSKPGGHDHSSRYIATKMDSFKVKRPNSEQDGDDASSSGEQQAKSPWRKTDSTSSTLSSLQQQQQLRTKKVDPPEIIEKSKSSEHSRGEDMTITTRENIIRARRPDPDGIHAANSGPVVTHNKKDKNNDTRSAAPWQQHQQRRRSLFERTKSKSTTYSSHRSSKTHEVQQKQVSPLAVMRSLVGDGEVMGAQLVSAFCRKGDINDRTNKKTRQARLPVPKHVVEQQPTRDNVLLEQDSDEGLCEDGDADFKNRVAPPAVPPSSPSSKKQTKKTSVYCCFVEESRSLD